jgi:hypothetical protein
MNVMWDAVFLVMILYNLVAGYHCFRGISCLHLHFSAGDGDIRFISGIGMTLHGVIIFSSDGENGDVHDYI